jgi:hypothetical protein
MVFFFTALAHCYKWARAFCYLVFDTSNINHTSY